MKIISVLLLSLFTFFSTSVHKQDSSRAQIEIREFDQDKLSNYQQDSQFQYDLPQLEGESILERAWRWLQEWYADLIGNGTTANLVDILFRIALVVAFVYFIIKIFGVEITTVFKPSKAKKLAYQVSEEQLMGIDFEAEIAQAIQQKQWRFAVRLTYLHALKLLADAEWLAVKKGKTNRDYLYELSGKQVEKDFERLSFIFDYTWYGHFEASDIILAQAKDHFDKIQDAKRLG